MDYEKVPVTWIRTSCWHFLVIIKNLRNRIIVWPIYLETNLFARSYPAWQCCPRGMLPGGGHSPGRPAQPGAQHHHRKADPGRRSASDPPRFSAGCCSRTGHSTQFAARCTCITALKSTCIWIQILHFFWPKLDPEPKAMLSILKKKIKVVSKKNCYIFFITQNLCSKLQEIFCQLSLRILHSFTYIYPIF